MIFSSLKTCIISTNFKNAKLARLFDDVNPIKIYSLSEDQADKLSDSQSTIVIRDVESEKITIEYGGQGITFPLNKSFENTVAIHHKVWTTVTLNDDSITFNTKLTDDGALSEEKIFKITDSDLISTSTNTKGVKAVRKYKRL